MDFKYKEYNCMLDKNEEGFIGYVKDIIELYKQYAKDLLDYLGQSDFDNVREVIELLEKLEKLDKNYLIMVDYPYNEWCYRIISKVY